MVSMVETKDREGGIETFPDPVYLQDPKRIEAKKLETRTRLWVTGETWEWLCRYGGRIFGTAVENNLVFNVSINARWERDKLWVLVPSVHQTTPCMNGRQTTSLI